MAGSRQASLVADKHRQRFVSLSGRERQL